MRLPIAFMLIGIVVLAGCTTPSPTTTTQQQTPQAQTPTSTTPRTLHEVDITSFGFTPAQLTIPVGDSLVFVNKDSVVQHLPASDPHPTHNGYPEPGGCIGSKFDACHGLAQGEKWEFIFTHAGHWCYHDHVNPSFTGCVDVQ